MSDRDAFGLPIKKNSASRKRPTNPFDIENVHPQPMDTSVVDSPPPDPPETEIMNEIKDEEVDDEESCVYNPSNERQLSRNSFKMKLMKAERKMLKQGFGHSVVAIDSEDENAVIRFLLSQKVFGYPGTKGTIFSNYWKFVMNRHPLFGLVCHHRLHPFKTKLRVIVFLCSLSFAFVLSVAMLDKMYFKEKFVCADGCDKANVQDEHGEQHMQCVGGANDGMDYERYKSSCEFYPPWAISAGAAAIIVPYTSALKFFATCDCVHGRPFFQNNCCGRGIKNLVEYLGGRVLFFFVVINTICTLVALYFAYFVLKMYTVLATFLFSKVLSYLYWFLWTAPYFSFKFPRDRKFFYRELRRQEELEEQVIRNSEKKKLKRVNPGTALLSSGDGDDDG